MAHLILRCHPGGRVIMSGVEIDPPTFKMLHHARTVPCRFCGQEHAWEIVDKVPEAAVLMSIRAEDFLGRSVQNEAYAAQAADPAIRELYQRIAGQWYQLAIEHETKAGLL